MDYRDTLNLPRTDFPMRARLPKREPETIAYWQEIDDNQQARQRRKGQPQFILHDGPPYANGSIHMGTALNKILKDIVNRFYCMQGYDTPYVPGWDTHGMPIEHAALKQLGKDQSQLAPGELRRYCADYAMKYVDVQREQFRRLGVRGDWDHPYLTLSPEYEARQVEVFGEMAQKGFIYKGLKPVYWCYTCETALAEAEVEYHEKASEAVYVKFPVVGDPNGILPGESDNLSVLIWTTTIWTLPANLAIAVHPEVKYALVKSGGERYLVAEALLEQVQKETGMQVDEVLGYLRGDELENLICRHPFMSREVPVVLADYVTLDQGTGCVHTAPGHGLEDYETGLRYGLDIFNPVDSQGVFLESAGEFAGLHVYDANPAIARRLDADGYLLAINETRHPYPHCWRCKNPILFRATEQWFASVKDFRADALAAIDQVRWYPGWGRYRIRNMVEERSDWCISRQRLWGVPMPIFYCRACGRDLITPETVAAVRDLFREHGSNAWFERDAEEILPPGTTCPDCGGALEKGQDTMDVWFDSGSSHMAVLDSHPDLDWPCDLYLEGSDQHRGWFQSSLLTAVAVRGRAPYRGVLTHGYVVDADGRKMSKSLGNVIDPADVIGKYGADILRLFVASSDFKADVRVSEELLDQMAEAYRKIRNTCRFLLGNLYDFDPETHQVPYRELQELDRWILLRLARVVERVTDSFQRYDFHLFYHAVHNFATVDLSSVYLDVVKDRVYCSTPDNSGRRAAQTAMYHLLQALVRMMAPVMAFTSEELWQRMPGGTQGLASVHLADWPEIPEAFVDTELEVRWGQLIEVRSEVTRVLEQLRQDQRVGQSLEADVTLWARGELYDLLWEYRDFLADFFIVSRAELVEWSGELPEGPRPARDLPGLAVEARPVEAGKCPRCWRYQAPQDFPESLCPRCSEVVDKLPGD